MSTTTTTTTTTTSDIDFETVKGRQQGTWASGNYAVIGTSLQIVGETLCEAVDVAAGWRVLDVAAGNGNASLAAARRNCDVIATDYVPELLDGTRARADADGLTLETRVADAEALPFADGAFDAVLSTFGVMFAPNQDASAAELVRVCRRGGRIGLANWTPEGFVGQMFKIVGKYVAPVPGLRSPLQWGTEERLVELFGDGVRSLDVTRRHFVFRYQSARHWVETFRAYYGPTLKAFGSLDPEGQEALAEDLVALANECDRSTNGSLAVPSEYLEIVAVRA